MFDLAAFSHTITVDQAKAWGKKGGGSVAGETRSNELTGSIRTQNDDILHADFALSLRRTEHHLVVEYGAEVLLCLGVVLAPSELHEQATVLKVGEPSDMMV